MKWKHFPRCWSFVRGIHRSPVNSTHKGQWRGGLMFSLICARKHDWANNREAGDLRRYPAHYSVTVMSIIKCGMYYQSISKLQRVKFGNSWAISYTLYWACDYLSMSGLKLNHISNEQTGMIRCQSIKPPVPTDVKINAGCSKGIYDR